MTHEELVEAAVAKVREIFWQFGQQNGRHIDEAMARALFALIAERLKEPTEEMLKVGMDDGWSVTSTHSDIHSSRWKAMLAASPLVPPKSKE